MIPINRRPRRLSTAPAGRVAPVGVLRDLPQRDLEPDRVRRLERVLPLEERTERRREGRRGASEDDVVLGV